MAGVICICNAEEFGYSTTVHGAVLHGVLRSWCSSLWSTPQLALSSMKYPAAGAFLCGILGSWLSPPWSTLQLVHSSMEYFAAGAVLHGVLCSWCSPPWSTPQLAQSTMENYSATAVLCGMKFTPFRELQICRDNFIKHCWRTLQFFLDAGQRQQSQWSYS